MWDGQHDHAEVQQDVRRAVDQEEIRARQAGAGVRFVVAPEVRHVAAALEQSEAEPCHCPNGRKGDDGPVAAAEGAADEEAAVEEEY